MEGSPRGAAGDRQRLIFRVGDRRHEIDAALVLEVIRPPHMTRVPHGPEALAGIVNLRGRPVPVLSMAKLFDQRSGDEIQHESRIIVYDNGGEVGLLVDEVLRLSADTSATPLQEIGTLLDAAFKLSRPARVERASHVDRNDGSELAVSLTALLSFRVAGQLYGLPLDQIREVTTPIAEMSVVPNAAAGLIGLMQLRDGVLPLVSLASLLGLEADHAVDKGSRIIVVEHAEDAVGLVVDEIDVIRRLPQSAIDTVPAVLQRGRGDAQIDAIGRIADGGLLMSILSPEKLFGHGAVVQAISEKTGAKPMEATQGRQDGAEQNGVEQFLIFQLGNESYGMPIASVDEVVRVPDQITRMPGAPSFVLGVMNLRGKPVPLIDQRSRFDLEGTAQTIKARAIIVTLGELQAGFVVDGASEVQALSSAMLSAAPEFASDQTDVFDRIAHIESDGRMLLLIDPQELLTRAERDIVAAVAHGKTVTADT